MKTLIYNASIITQNEKREIIKRGFIVVKNGEIFNIGNGEFTGDFNEFDNVFDIAGKTILPGLINTHVHLGETAYKDLLPENFTLEEYLGITEYLAKKFSSIEVHRKTIGEYTLLQLVKNGTSTICGGRVGELATEWGLRNLSGFMVMNSDKLRKYYIDIEKSFDSESENGFNGRLDNSGVFIHSLGFVNESALLSVKRILEKNSELILMIHVAETKKQEENVLKKYRLTTIEVLQKYGLLSNKTLLVHGNWCSEKDLEIIKENGGTLVHCLSSNLKVADKVLDINKVVKKGINVCIATDGFCTADTFSVLQEAKSVLNYNKNKESNKINAQTVLDMITLNAAKALKMLSKIGSIEIGKAADLVFVSVLQNEDNNDFISAVVTGSTVEGLMIDGSVIIWDKRMSMKNEKNIIDKYRSLTNKITGG
jgi:5-methylthioadenosine/S-adenosylhomocysteine deaminase